MSVWVCAFMLLLCIPKVHPLWLRVSCGMWVISPWTTDFQWDRPIDHPCQTSSVTCLVINEQSDKVYHMTPHILFIEVPRITLKIWDNRLQHLHNVTGRTRLEQNWNPMAPHTITLGARPVWWCITQDLITHLPQCCHMDETIKVLQAEAGFIREHDCMPFVPPDLMFHAPLQLRLPVVRSQWQLQQWAPRKEVLMPQMVLNSACRHTLMRHMPQIHSKGVWCG